MVVNRDSLSWKEAGHGGRKRQHMVDEAAYVGKSEPTVERGSLCWKCATE